jgi:nicotinamidase-related amidase
MGDLHGNAPDDAPLALLLVDVVNDLEFEGGDELLPRALAMAQRLAVLRQRCTAAAVPVVYVNDNFGRWRSNIPSLTRHCTRDGVRGRPVVEALSPGDDDYFVLKPKHSGFYATPLGLLLEHIGAKTLIVTGLTTDRCVLFTAHDAYLREFRLFTPSDCMASIEPEAGKLALQHMERVLRADTRSSDELDLAAMRLSSAK